MDLKYYISTIPELASLKNIPQNHDYHEEGDVLIHTEMMLEALANHKEWKLLHDHEKNVLSTAVIFHDIGKLACTKEENGKIISPNHSKIGALMTRELLWKGIPDPVPFNMREQIVQMVKYHGLPLWFYEKENPEKSVIKASLNVNLRLLSILAESDVHGRLCSDKKQLLEKIEFFKEYAAEKNCFDKQFNFPNNFSRFNYFYKEKGIPGFDYYDDTEFSVILMSGLPGSGKDYWIKHNSRGLPVISLDELRNDMDILPEKNQGKVINAAKEKAKKLLAAKQSFIWNATNFSKKIRSTLISLFTKYNAKVKIVYIENSYKNLLKQNSERNNSVPAKVLSKMIKKNEIPEIHEAHEVEYVIYE